MMAFFLHGNETLTRCVQHVYHGKFDGSGLPTHKGFTMANDQRKLQATTISQRIQECSMVVKFAFKRKDNSTYPLNARETDYDGMLNNALGHVDRSSLKFYESELDRFNESLVRQGEDYTIDIVYALPLLDSHGKEKAQSILMREQEGGPIFWAAVKKWLAENTVKTAGNKLSEAFLYWVREHPTLTIDFVEIRASYLDQKIPGAGRRRRYSDVIVIPFNYVDLLSYDNIGNSLIAFLIGAIPKRGDFDSTIRSLPATTCDKRVEDPRSAFNFAGKIHFPTTVSGESSVSENLAPDALEN
jgi:hypothetical protein